MEDLLTNWTFYVVLFMMLFGAFMIGYYFGNSSEQTSIPVDPKLSGHKNSLASTSESDIAGNIDLEESNNPGTIRALKTRERSGTLSHDAKMSLAEDKLNFKSLGRGDEKNKDDFQKITGIGPFIEEKLNTIGIFQYRQLASMTERDMDAITALIDFFPGRIQRDDWKGQAIALAKKEKANARQSP